MCFLYNKHSTKGHNRVKISLGTKQWIKNFLFSVEYAGNKLDGSNNCTNDPFYLSLIRTVENVFENKDDSKSQA